MRTKAFIKIMGAFHTSIDVSANMLTLLFEDGSSYRDHFSLSTEEYNELVDQTIAIRDRIKLLQIESEKLKTSLGKIWRRHEEC